MNNNHKYPLIEFSELSNLEVIGRGGFGTVYKGKWKGTDIAVKKFSPSTEKAQQTLEKELMQSFKIEKHPHIVDVHGVSFKDAQTYLLLELADGGSLDRVLYDSSNKEYTTKRAIQWMQQCAEGVAFLHSRKPKLLHRDLKPANLLLTNNYNKLKICDFGTVAELKSTMTDNRGSLAWMAPEVFNNKKYNQSCDVYSFGIIFWETLTREQYCRTFQNPFAIPKAVRDNGVRPIVKDDWANEIKSLMTSCWDPSPTKRPSMKDIVSKIKDFYKQNYKTDNEVGKTNGKTTEWRPYKLKLTSNRRWVTLDVVKRLTAVTPLNEEAYKKGMFGITSTLKSNGVLKEYRITKARRDNLEKHRSFQTYTYESFFLTLRGIYTSKTKIYYNLEYAQMGSLYKYLHRTSPHTYTKENTILWLIDCAEGLTHLHFKAMTFNNLTSRNLFINKERRLQIGLPAMEDEANYLKTTYKSAAWMAPEVHSSGKYSQKSDIYSLGVILWEVWTGKIPFQNISPEQIAKMVLKGERLPAVENSLRDGLLNKCWQTNSHRRPQAYEVLRQLNLILAKQKDPKPFLLNFKRQLRLNSNRSVIKT